MKLMSFFSQNIIFIIAIIAAAGILIGRIWSNFLNWGRITDPQMIIRNGQNYKLINLYFPKGWTEGWEVGSVLCFETVHRRFFVKSLREIYISGDRIRFTDEDGPVIGSYYKATYTHASSGSILMTQISRPAGTKDRPKIDWSKIK
ncbi:MAG: hypothetical protein ACHQF0_15320 [Chitinophagales bacterium]